VVRWDGRAMTEIESPPIKAPTPKVAHPRYINEQVALEIEPSDLCAVFGVTDPAVAARLLSQLLGVLQPDTSEAFDQALINQALGFIRGIGPKDTTEAMTATLMAAAHHAAHDCARRAMHPAQSPGGRAMYLTLSMKATRAFAQLKQSLDIGRGKVTTQRVVVEHLTVQAGAQALIAVDTRQGGGG
jgi:hypothetical protein